MCLCGFCSFSEIVTSSSLSLSSLLTWLIFREASREVGVSLSHWHDRQAISHLLKWKLKSLASCNPTHQNMMTNHWRLVNLKHNIWILCIALPLKIYYFTIYLCVYCKQCVSSIQENQMQERYLRDDGVCGWSKIACSASRICSYIGIWLDSRSRQLADLYFGVYRVGILFRECVWDVPADI